MTDELKPCPLCGGEAVYESSQPKHGIVHSAYCEECGIEIARLNKQGAIEAWNRRIE
jgi:Lar family restriction alleviation protein